jgi:hypothetical protein
LSRYYNVRHGAVVVYFFPCCYHHFSFLLLLLVYNDFVKTLKNIIFL